jgi:hypothetical protein
MVFHFSRMQHAMPALMRRMASRVRCTPGAAAAWGMFFSRGGLSRSLVNLCSLTCEGRCASQDPVTAAIERGKHLPDLALI